MAKRGERRPWRVRYVWTTGVKGTDTFTTRDEADSRADKIRAAGERWDDRDVTVTVERRDQVTR